MAHRYIKDGDKSCNDTSYDKPFADVLHHLDKGIAQCHTHTPEKAKATGRILVTAAALRFLNLCRLAGRAAAAEAVDKHTAESCCRQRGSGAYHGERKTHQAECGDDGIDTGLWGGDEKRCHCAVRRTVFPERHGSRYDTARTQWKRDAEQGGIDNRTERRLGKITGVASARHKGVENAGEKEAQKKIGRHLVDKMKYFFHIE